jgi:hypothetical protein
MLGSQNFPLLLITAALEGERVGKLLWGFRGPKPLDRWQSPRLGLEMIVHDLFC